MKIEFEKAYFVPTQELEDDFLKQAEEQGWLWMTGRKPTEFGVHAANQDNLCICTEKFKRIYFRSVDNVLRHSSMQITPWYVADADIAPVDNSTEKPKSKTEVIRLGNLKIVFNGDYTIVTDGRFTGKAKRNPADEYDAVLGLKLAVERYEKSKSPKTLTANDIITAYELVTNTRER